jgi:hypothetical protein
MGALARVLESASGGENGELALASRSGAGKDCATRTTTGVVDILTQIVQLRLDSQTRPRSWIPAQSVITC